MDNKHISLKETPKRIQAHYKHLMKIQDRIDKLNGRVKNQKSRQTYVKWLIIHYLQQTGFNGILARTKSIYMQSNITAPSFKQVMNTAENQIPKSIVNKLNDIYESMYSEGELSLRIKNRKDGKFK